jgi:hypothetical protein
MKVVKDGMLAGAAIGRISTIGQLVRGELPPHWLQRIGLMPYLQLAGSSHTGTAGSNVMMSSGYICRLLKMTWQKAFTMAP